MGTSCGPVVGGTESREKSRSRSWTRQISDKTIVMFYVNCSEKKFSKKKKSASPLRP